VASGQYMGEHRLASFAVYLLSTPVPKVVCSPRDRLAKAASSSPDSGDRGGIMRTDRSA